MLNAGQSYRVMGRTATAPRSCSSTRGVRLSIRTPEQARQRRRGTDVRLTADDVQALITP
jgi:hypothetical protein